MNELIQEGKIRYYGVANETPWGIAKWHSTAKTLGLKGPVAASNPYSLLTKNFVETHLIEAVYHCNMSFIGYSPLCEGVLTGTPPFVVTIGPASFLFPMTLWCRDGCCGLWSGKYLDATEKVDGRLHNQYGHMVHLLRQEVDDAVFAHKMVADKRFIPLHAWALNYCITRPWVTSTCIGARNLKQLQDAILSQNVRIPEIPYADEDIELVSVFLARTAVVDVYWLICTVARCTDDTPTRREASTASRRSTFCWKKKSRRRIAHGSRESSSGGSGSASS